MSAPSPIVVSNVNHSYGRGALRAGVLHDVSIEIRAGEIVILTGPSGSGKTTLLTLIGALRATQEGEVRVLGEELCGAGPSTIHGVRRRIGYIFQAHNLLDSLTAVQNVQMGPHRELGPGFADRLRGHDPHGMSEFHEAAAGEICPVAAGADPLARFARQDAADAELLDPRLLD